jgi:hypothetical protein
MRTALPIIDEFIVNEDGSVTAWACAINDLGVAQVKLLPECAAVRQECPRGFTKAFECRHGPEDAEAG